jgi:PAS domain S-box-containing protein
MTSTDSTMPKAASRHRRRWMRRLVPIGGALLDGFAVRFRRGEPSAVAAARAEAERWRLLAEETNRQLLEAQRVGKLGHWIADEVAGTLVWSPQMFEITGLPPQPVMPLDLSRLPPLHPEDRAEFFRVRECAAASGETLRTEVRFVRPDGEIRWVQIQMRAHYDAAGRFVRLFGTTQDITERKQAEDAVKAAREQLIDAIEAFSEGFVLFDRDDRFVLTNTNYRRFYADRMDLFEPGTRYEDMLRRSLARGRDHLGGEDPEAWIRRMVAWHQACGEPMERQGPDGRWIRQVERRTRDGGIVGIRTDVTAIKTTEAALVRKVQDLEAAQDRLEKLSRDLTAMADDLAAARDAAEQKAAELARSEARFRGFALTSSHWLWETDAQHRFTYMSEGALAFGFSTAPGSLLGRTRREIAVDAEGETAKWQEHYAALERREPFRDFTYRWKNDKGREGVASVSGDPVFDAAGRFLGYRGSGRDITEQVLADSALREAKQAAEAANLAKSQFLANMSHELRTPLNAIIGFSEMIERAMKGPLAPDYQEYGRMIRQSGEHLHTIINDILDLAKVDAGKFELRTEAGVDLRRIAEACVALVRGHAEVGEVRLATEIDEHLPLLVVDPTRLKQILLNLLSNAIKFTEAGGSVALAIRRAADGGVTFQVRDTGVGMTAAEIEIALEPFGQVDAGYTRKQEGTGLGLPLARRLAELHGGALAIDSAKGRGTTVTVRLPAATAAGEPLVDAAVAMLAAAAG